MSLKDEIALRLDAMEWLRARTNDGLNPISREQLSDFHFRSTRLPLIDRGRGIRKPADCRAALSIMTVHTRQGRTRPYEDVVGPDGFPRYKMRSGPGGTSDNRGVVAAMHEKLPVIWLIGVDPGWFQAVFPVFIAAFEEPLDQFVLVYDQLQQIPNSASPVEEVTRRYAVRETRLRLHQPLFRSMVVRAYETQCAVCSLRISELLDAAHIVPDSDMNGIANVANGLCLCKIHHAAFDAGILGISPDYRVELRHDILEEVDGPIFEHGLKGLHGQSLRVLPKRRNLLPDRDLLSSRYSRFISA